MEAYELIIMILGMAVFGIFPPIIVARYIQKQGIKMAEERTSMVIAHAQKVLSIQFIDAVDGMKQSLRDSLNGYMGQATNKIQNKLSNDMGLAKVPKPAQKVLGDAVGNIAEEYFGVKKKTASQGIMALFNRPSKQQIQQDQNTVMNYLPPDAPKIIEDFNRS